MTTAWSSGVELETIRVRLVSRVAGLVENEDGERLTETDQGRGHADAVSEGAGDHA